MWLRENYVPVAPIRDHGNPLTGFLSADAVHEEKDCQRRPYYCQRRYDPSQRKSLHFALQN
jgi:hypothetical protein